MIMKCQVSVSSLLLNIPHFSACAQNDGSIKKKQAKDLCGGERARPMFIKLSYSCDDRKLFCELASTC